MEYLDWGNFFQCLLIVVAFIMGSFFVLVVACVALDCSYDFLKDVDKTYKKSFLAFIFDLIKMAAALSVIAASVFYVVWVDHKPSLFQQERSVHIDFSALKPGTSVSFGDRIVIGDDDRSNVYVGTEGTYPLKNINGSTVWMGAEKTNDYYIQNDLKDSSDLVNKEENNPEYH